MEGRVCGSSYRLGGYECIGFFRSRAFHVPVLVCLEGLWVRDE